MTKLQMISSVTELVGNTPKLPKEFKSVLEALLNEYKGAKGSSVEAIPQIVEIDGIEYAWCNKHERYEIGENFRAGKEPRKYQVLCRAAEHELNSISKEIKDCDKIMMDENSTEEQIMSALSNKRELDIKRKGTYDVADIIQDIEGYDYESDTFDVSLNKL